MKILFFNHLKDANILVLYFERTVVLSSALTKKNEICNYRGATEGEDYDAFGPQLKLSTFRAESQNQSHYSDQSQQS